MDDKAKAMKILNDTYPKATYYLDFKTPIDLLVATILSAQVRDEVVNSVTPELFNRYRTADDYAKTDVEELIGYIKKVSFAGNKARNIIGACKIMVEKHAGKVPKTMEELTELPGIGRKTANVILQNAYGVVVGIACDTHVLRVAFRLGWTKNTNPEKVEKDLMEAFDKSHWDKLPHLLKNHGREVCTAQKPACSKCPLSKICPRNGVEVSI